MKLERRAAPSTAMLYLSPVIALLATLVSGTAIFALLGQPPAAVMYAFFVAPVRDLYGVSELLLKATPLLLCAVGLSLCFRARVWNIGAEGQFLLGTLGGGAVALACNDAATGFGWAILASVIAGVAAGAVWAVLVALLKDRFDCSEILTSIMLNYVAMLLSGTIPITF